MKKELTLDACVGFLVGVMVGLAIMILSRIGISLGSGGAFDSILDQVFSQPAPNPINFDWLAIFEFLLLFGIIFALLTSFYTYSKIGLRKQLHANKQKKSAKETE